MPAIADKKEWLVLVCLCGHMMSYSYGLEGAAQSFKKDMKDGWRPPRCCICLQETAVQGYCGCTHTNHGHHIQPKRKNA